MKNRKTYFKIYCVYNYSFFRPMSSPLWLIDVYKAWSIKCMNAEEKESAIKKMFKFLPQGQKGAHEHEKNTSN